MNLNKRKRLVRGVIWTAVVFVSAFGIAQNAWANGVRNTAHRLPMRAAYDSPTGAATAPGSRVVPVPTRTSRPWWVREKRVFVRETPYFYNPCVGMYFGGAALDLALGEKPPMGWTYCDPVNSLKFQTLSAYRQFLKGHPHRTPGILTLVRI